MRIFGGVHARIVVESQRARQGAKSRAVKDALRLRLGCVCVMNALSEVDG